MFGENPPTQTTLASMFPISYSYIRTNYMQPKTPDPNTPLSPDRVRPLMTGPFSLTYTGSLQTAALNTELLFLARTLCSPRTGPSLIMSITFTGVTLDNVSFPLVFQGLILDGDLTIDITAAGSITVYVGLCTMTGNLSFTPSSPIISFEFYSNIISGTITLPAGTVLENILVYGQYPQITLSQLQNTMTYPLLLSLLYLNGTDGRHPRDIPVASVGFGAYTLSGLTQSSYPNILTLAIPDPWSADIGTLFPNLVSLYVIESPVSGELVVPLTSSSNYNTFTMISCQDVTSLDLTVRAPYLTGGIRIVGCQNLYGIALRPDTTSTVPALQLDHLIIERCALLYLRGVRGLTTQPRVVRLGDQSYSSSNISYTQVSRLLDLIVDGVPNLGSFTADSSDYLPNVLASLAESFPTLPLYLVMQTVEYRFTKNPVVMALNPTSNPSSTYSQYSGGSNPVVPTNTSSLSSILVLANPFGIVYDFKIVAPASVPIGSTIRGLPAENTSTPIVAGNSKNALLKRLTSTNKWWIYGILIAVAALVIIIVVIVLARRSSLVKHATNPDQPVKLVQ